MVPIYICDDDPQILEFLRKIIDDVVLINQYDMQIAEATGEPERLLTARSAHDVRSIFFWILT